MNIRYKLVLLLLVLVVLRVVLLVAATVRVIISYNFFASLLHCNFVSHLLLELVTKYCSNLLLGLSVTST